ncbi:hypothetical protein M0R04_15525 [Candidatus Dojkabacteria bacterium]|jgi:hypothetical protein|nr:hypothetical protein [Candidatus Dojkabacteria bacterium]
MPKNTTSSLVRGTEAEVKLFTEVNKHYKTAREDLDIRIQRKNGFDDADKMFASHIDENGWPYRSLMFDPTPYTVILEKNGRLVGSKPKGRMVPREGGDSLGAMINNELLSYQWDDNTRLGDSMLSKWAMMDMNVRKYGSSFAICKWRKEKKVSKDGEKISSETFYDGPDFTVCNPRDVLANPSYSFINKWFQYREYVTVDELKRTNESSTSKAIYKNLDILEVSLAEEAKNKGDRRDNNYTIKNKEMRGLTDYMGSDETYPAFEVITEYRPDRWIKFAPKHGVIIQDIPNPYKHGEIPVVHLKYYPLADDLYGVNELEPVSKEIRAINAHLSAYSDTIALALRPPVHINPVNVRMHTIEWNPEAKWLMTNPNVDVQQMKIDTSMTTNFQSIYTVLKGSLMNALGEQSQGMSSANPTQDASRVTATEIKDTSYTRNIRDNMNQNFLSEALKKQIIFWHVMNQQFMFKGSVDKQRIIRIVGREAAEYFNQTGLADIRPTQNDAEMIAMGQMQQEDVIPGPRYAVNVGEDDMGNMMEAPKYIPDENGAGGNLIVEEGDLAGTYDFIPDIESMGAPSDQQVETKLTAILGMLTNPAIQQGLASEGKKTKFSELLIKMLEASKVIKDADQYFEDLPPQQPMGQVGPDGQPIPQEAPTMPAMTPEPTMEGMA